MSIEGDGNLDEYTVTALQIFEYCGADSSSTLRVDALMDKFAPFVKTNKAEYSHLKSLLDPKQNNPEISVSRLAETLNKYSENQKVKVDLEESFNLRSGQVPHDSDSGISTDGFQLLEELQCELREKAHLAHQLRSQLDFTDRQHEEAVAALTAERDSLRSHLNMLREENMSLTHIRGDYEEVCERLAVAERAAEDARRELDAARRRLRALGDRAAELDAEKVTLSELLAKSKEECHRINDMYASRQSLLLEQNERLRSERADLAARLQDHEEFVQTVLKEKVLVEMELKEMLNRTNQTQLKMDRSIDISYTEDQMLTALDSLNLDSRFASDNRIDEESFASTFKEDQGRATNLSLFDEIRLSFCNMSRQNMTGISMCADKSLDSSFTNIATQTDVTGGKDENDNNKEYRNVEIQTDVVEKSYDNFKNVEIQANIGQIKEYNNVETQTNNNKVATKSTQTICTQSKVHKALIPRNLRTSKFKKLKAKTVNTSMQTDDIVNLNNNNACTVCTKCLECEKLHDHTKRLEGDYKYSHDAIADIKHEIDEYEKNLEVLKRYVDEGNERNNYLQGVVDGLKSKLVILEEACSHQRDEINKLCCETLAVAVQTECEQISTCTQTDLPCSGCVKRNAPHRLRRYLWEPLKCLFQLFAVLCFLCAISALYGATRRWQSPCAPLALWSWLQPHEIMDLLFRIEYIADVPM